MPWNAELTHEEDVERGAQRSRNLVGDRHAAAREREDDEVGVVPVFLQALSQLDAGFPAVREWHRTVEVHGYLRMSLPASCK